MRRVETGYRGLSISASSWLGWRHALEFFKNFFFANLRMMMSVDASCTMRCQSSIVERGWGSASQDAEDGRGSHDLVLDQSELCLVLVGA